jgi:predicted lipoprotein with Yx(FWY)xxD motif
VVSTPYGPALGSRDGRVLYAWDKEASGAAVCVEAACVEKWPPLLASKVTVAAGVGADGASFALVDRPDGTKQVALNGKRLYNMMVDAPGEANCQGAEGWWILKPDGSKNTSQTPA